MYFHVPDAPGSPVSSKAAPNILVKSVAVAVFPSLSYKVSFPFSCSETAILNLIFEPLGPLITSCGSLAIGLTFVFFTKVFPGACSVMTYCAVKSSSPDPTVSTT